MQGIELFWIAGGIFKVKNRIGLNLTCDIYSFITCKRFPTALGEFPAEGFYFYWEDYFNFFPFFLPLLSGPEVILASGKCFALGVLLFPFPPSSVEWLGERKSLTLIRRRGRTSCSYELKHPYRSS